MHATQPQGGACPEPRDTDHATNFFVDLLGDDQQFRAWVASAVGIAANPVTLPDSAEPDGYPLGTCEICGTAGTPVRADPDPDPRVPHIVCVDQSACAACFATDEPTAAHPVILPDSAEPDGYVVTDAGLKALADTGGAPGTVGSVLRSAALYLERHGWVQGAYYDPTATIFTPAADMAGAIGMVCYGGPVEAPAQHFDDPGFLDFEEAVLHLDRFLLAENGSESYEFNDAKGRTVEQVTDVLRQAAARSAEELIDVLRALGTYDADMADRVKLLVPGGIWAEPDDDQGELSLPILWATPDDDGRGPVGHLDRPHLPGNLFGCPTCEERCFCADLPWICVHCARAAAWDSAGGSQGGDAR
ncbi:hypothetical protein AB0368_25270 [Actinoplanes sp. NPDC051475]|uniref:DUF6197 family protein n=1 Tax=Actinoplanes sp. NPDC051475 TaxID=3157225 RepID=UPI00344B5AEF